MCKGKSLVEIFELSFLSSFSVPCSISASLSMMSSRRSKASTICSRSPFSGSSILASFHRVSLDFFSKDTALMTLFPLISSTAFWRASFSLDSFAYWSAFVGLWSGDPTVSFERSLSLLTTEATSPPRASCSADWS